MKNEISKSLKCVVMRNGIEIWKESDRLENLIRELMDHEKKIGFVKIDDQLVNAVDIVGVFDPQTMEDHTKRKNGEWKCKHGEWHERSAKCECSSRHLSGDDLVRAAGGVVSPRR